MKNFLYFLLFFYNIVFVQGQEYKDNIDRIEAIVGGEIILKSDIQDKYFNYQLNGINFHQPLKGIHFAPLER